MKIVKVLAEEVFDSRGTPTVKCTLFTDDGTQAWAMVPSGASVSEFEAKEVRDGGKRLGGKGVLQALKNIEDKIAPLILYKEPQAVDMDMKIIELDGTMDKSVLGSNATLAVSMALYRLHAKMEEMPLYEFIAYVIGYDTVRLPFPFFNLINGGAHAHNGLSIQEFLVMPIATTTFRSALEGGITIYQELKELLLANNRSVAVGDEGGFADGFEHNQEALEYLMEAMSKAQKKHNVHCVMALDVAASQFYDKQKNVYFFNDQLMDTSDMIEYYKKITKDYSIYSIEDGLSQTDWQGWQHMCLELKNVQIIGDDIFATNIYRIAQGAQDKVATGVIIKPNQIGTITETLQAIKLSQENGLNTIISHRSGDTEDTFIADLAVGSSAGQIKTGGCSRSERMAKYNRLLSIEDELTLKLLDS